MRQSVYNKAIEELVVIKGEKKGYYFVGDLTTKEILEKLELPIVKVNHNYILRTIRTFYPKSSFEKSSEGDGFLVRVRIRSK
jgi:uncharacterized protein (UPF0218 family)